ncbi:MAG: tyrosine-type recombinase/integrase [Thermoanaerobaculia bacterium]
MYSFAPLPPEHTRGSLASGIPLSADKRDPRRPAGRMPVGVDANGRFTLQLPSAPLQFASLEHMDERVEAVVTHAATVRGLQPSTCRWARQSYTGFRRFVKEHRLDRRFLSGDLRDQTEILGAWVASLRERGIARLAINTYWRGLTAVFRWIAWQDSVVNPFLFTESPSVGRIDPHCLTKAAAETVLTFVRNYAWKTGLERNRCLVIVGLLLLAGLRRSEAAALRYGDVDVDQGTIRVVRGKGQHGGKTRTAYMPPQLREMVRAYQEARRKVGRSHPEFLSSLQENRGIGPRSINKLFHFISRETGIRVTPHSLRHTFATLLRQAGVPDRLSMELLGHTSLTMLQRYSHVFSAERGEAAERLVLDVDL